MRLPLNPRDGTEPFDDVPTTNRNQPVPRCRHGRADAQKLLKYSEATPKLLRRGAISEDERRAGDTLVNLKDIGNRCLEVSGRVERLGDEELLLDAVKVGRVHVVHVVEDTDGTFGH